MNTMIKRIAEAVRKAIDEAPYQVKFQQGTYDVIDTSINKIKGCYVDSGEAEDLMDELNDEWIARKVVESMREFNNDICIYPKCECPISVPLGMKPSETSCPKGSSLNEAIDAILKE